MRHNHYSEKFYQDESPKNHNESTKQNASSTKLNIHRHLTFKDPNTTKKSSAADMKRYHDEQFISNSHRKKYEKDVGKRIKQSMGRHILDQEALFNDKHLEEQDERMDEDKLLQQNLDLLEEELRKQELNHDDHIVNEELRKFD